MNEKDWNILTTLYKEKNITKAAQQLYISQPALTYRIKELEKEFNTVIIIRGSRGIEFTTKGEYLVKYAQNMISQLLKTKEQLVNMNQNISGTLRLAVSGMFARHELPSLLKTFLTMYPDVEINLKTGWSSEINLILQKEEAHLGIIRGNSNWQGNQLLLNEEKICIVSNTIIDLQQLPQLPRINYKTDISLKNTIENWWNQTYIVPPKITMETDRSDTCKQMILNGLGYSILPEICIQKDDPLYTIPITIKENNYVVRQTWLIYRDSSLELKHVKAFTTFLKEYKNT